MYYIVYSVILASKCSNLRKKLALDVIDALNRGEQDIPDNRVKDFKRILITKALQHTGGRRIEAAHQLGIGRNTLTRKIQELGIDGQY